LNQRTREGRKLRRLERSWRCERWEASSLSQKAESTGERELGPEERREGMEWEDLTSFGISQIVNKDCLSSAESCFITDLDTENKESRSGD
jgi:hypothetical protein